MKFIDLTGKKFGKRTVLSYMGESKWLCQCQCGTKGIVNARDINKGNAGSCRKCRAPKKPIELGGKTFGKWTVLSYAGKSRWLCRCVCKKEVLVNGHTLRQGQKKGYSFRGCSECRLRRRFAIGEIVGSPKGWPESYWFVKSHGPDSGKHSTEILEHHPTGIIEMRGSNFIRRGCLPDMMLMLSLTHTYKSAKSHWDEIFRRTRTNRNYKKMPFQSEWNPDRGGSFMCAAWEIEQEIGSRPSEKHQLAIITWHKGFVRGNLRWDPRHVNVLEAHIRKALNSGMSVTKVHQLVREVHATLPKAA
jgi:hypothetical protein